MGFDPADRGAWQVSFIQPGMPLVRSDFSADLPEHGCYQEIGLVGEQEDTYAPWESFAVDQLGLSRDERFAYAEAVERQEDALIHRLLGHPDPVQGDMQLDVNWPATASTAQRKRLPRSTRASASTWRG